MDTKKLTSLLDGSPPAEIERFVSYCFRLKNERDKKTDAIKNPWMQDVPEEKLADLFKRVKNEGLAFDGVHVTLQSTGISYDYIAYKNKMLLAYPETIIDVGLVYEGDKFVTSKESGKVKYSHVVANPLGQKGEDVIGGYCVIKNKRGESITLLSRDDIEQHRKVAKTDYIWADWFKEMAFKTIVKKACKQHYADIYTEIEEADNENYDLTLPLDADLAHKQAIEKIDSIEELRAYWDEHKGSGAGFAKLVTLRKKELTQTPNENT